MCLNFLLKSGHSEYCNVETGNSVLFPTLEFVVAIVCYYCCLLSSFSKLYSVFCIRSVFSATFGH